jgi:hypothetical protein
MNPRGSFLIPYVACSFNQLNLSAGQRAAADVELVAAGVRSSDPKPL